MVSPKTTAKGYLTIDAGGTYLKSAILNKKANVLHGSDSMVKSFSEGSRDEILLAFGKTVSHGLAYIESKGMQLGGIGIAFPGPFDYQNGIPLMEHKFQNINGLNLREAIHQLPGIPFHVPIQFIHDANSVLIGEIWKGNAQGFSNAAVVTIGTGLGFAFSQNEVVQRNRLGGPQVTIFKLPYREGILEDYTAKRGFLSIYKKISGNREVEGINVSDIGKWADEGNVDCIRTFREVGEILGESLINILRERDIQCLLFGGQISKSFHHLEGVLKQGLSEVECLRKISAVRSIDNAALLGTLRAIGDI